MEGLRMYGGFHHEGVSKGVKDDGRWTDHISIQCEYFNEIVSMRDEYQQMFEEFFEKFKLKANREIELEKQLEKEKLMVKDLQAKNQQSEEKIARLTQKLVGKENEDNNVCFEEKQTNISKLEANCQEKDEEIEKLTVKLEASKNSIDKLVQKTEMLQNERDVAIEQLKCCQQKCEDLEQSNNLMNGRINTLRIARDVYQTQVRTLQKKLSMRENKVDGKCYGNISNEITVYREKVKSYETEHQKCENEINNMRNERDKLAADMKLLERTNQDQNEQMEQMKIQIKNSSEALKLQQETNENLRDEMLTMNEEIIKCNAALKSLKETNKVLENKTWNMTDSSDDIYRYIQEIKQNLNGKKKYFGKFFTRNRLTIDHLQCIEDITNIYE